MPTVLEILPDKRNFPLWGTPKSDTVREAQLAADTNQAVAIPSGARFCLVTCEEKVFYDVDQTVTLPSSSSFTNGSAELIESGRLLTLDSSASNLNFRSANQARITLAFYQ